MLLLEDNSINSINISKLLLLGLMVNFSANTV
jgi:hypothetical protein